MRKLEKINKYYRLTMKEGPMPYLQTKISETWGLASKQKPSNHLACLRNRITHQKTVRTPQQMPWQTPTHTSIVLVILHE